MSFLFKSDKINNLITIRLLYHERFYVTPLLAERTNQQLDRSGRNNPLGLARAGQIVEK